MDGRRPANGGRPHFGQPDVKNVTRLDHVGNRSDRVLDRDIRIKPRWPIAVNVIHPKSGKTMCQRILDPLRACVAAEPLAGGSPEGTEFHRQDCVIAPGASHHSDQQFVVAH